MNETEREKKIAGDGDEKRLPVTEFRSERGSKETKRSG